MSAQKQYKKDKFVKINKIKQIQHNQKDFVVALSIKDKDEIISKMGDLWANDNISNDIDKHFSLPNISIGIKKGGNLRAFLLITVGKNEASGTALYSDNSMFAKRKLYKLYKKISSELKGYKLYYLSQIDIFANHTQIQGGLRWVDL